MFPSKMDKNFLVRMTEYERKTEFINNRDSDVLDFRVNNTNNSEAIYGMRDSGTT